MLLTPGPVMPETGAGVPLLPPQYLADQLTLIQPGEAYYPHQIIRLLYIYLTQFNSIFFAIATTGPWP